MSGEAPNLEKLLNNPSQRTPCVLVLDASQSMEATTAKGTRRIDELNIGMKALESELKDDPVAKMRVQLGIVSIGGPGGDADKMMDWTDAIDFQAFDLSCGGVTPLAKGLRIALDMIESQKQVYRSAGVSYTRPWLMVITDGEPTDSPTDWAGAAAACRQAESMRKCVIFPIGVADANVAKLQEISTTPVRALDQTKFTELFQWLSASLATQSQSAPGQTVPLGSTDPWAAVKL
jgi:uncharacterized protein YegL